MGLGSKKKDNGILLLVCLDEKKVRIEVGYGLEGVLTDTKCGLIIRNFIAPDFKKFNYSEGIKTGVNLIAGYATGNEEIKNKVDSSEEDDDDIDDDDLEDMADDIANMSDDDLNDMAHSLKEPPVPEGPEVSLTPDEEQHADDLMQVAGAAALIRGEMNAEERTSLVESVSDLRVGMTEGFFNDSLIMDLKESVADVTMDDDDAFTESKIYNKTTVKMSKKARLNQLFEIAVITCARAHNDPAYMKYKKACKIKKFYRAQMRQRYRSEATKRMKVLFARLKQSKSPIIKSLGKKVD